MNETGRHRVFFALWPESAAVAHLSALGQNLAAGSGRLTRPESLHLTLAFLGAVAAARLPQLEEIAAGIRVEAFELSIDRLGFWPQRGILWAGCRQAPQPLLRLATELSDALRAADFSVDSRPGAARVPHLTLARAVRCAALPRLGTPIRWQASEFALVESRLKPSAASYLTLSSFPLGKLAAAAGPGG
jgi:2'-5' RNA ligase